MTTKSTAPPTTKIESAAQRKTTGSDSTPGGPICRLPLLDTTELRRSVATLEAFWCESCRLCVNGVRTCSVAVQQCMAAARGDEAYHAEMDFEAVQEAAEAERERRLDR